MQQREPDWSQLRACVGKWFSEAEARLERAQAEMTIEQSKVGFAAAYCLASCHDYLESALDAFDKGRPYAGSACVRPVAETAMIFLWCVPSDVDHQERIERWVKTSLKEEERFLDSLAKTSLFRQGDSELADSLDGIRSMLDDLKHRKELPNLKQMLESIDQRLSDNLRASDMYPMLYQYLCASSHARFAPERHFRSQGEIVEKIDRLTMPRVVPWVALTSAFWLIFAIYGYFGWEVTEIKTEYAEAMRQINT